MFDELYSSALNVIDELYSSVQSSSTIIIICSSSHYIIYNDGKLMCADVA